MKIDIQTVSALIELGLKVVQRTREINGTPADTPLTADEVRAMPIGDVDDLIAQGRAKANPE